MFLLDTNVVSELRMVKSGKANHNLVRWAKSVPISSLFLSVISILEIEVGILLLDRRDPTQADILRGWLSNGVLPTFAGRLLSVDVEVARACAALHVPNPKSDRDAIIAATALVHGMTVVTRNVRDFEQTKVGLLNPWESKH